MKIKSIKLKNFKRFTDLTIEELPETAKLVVMIGPNGSGKSSVFDALHAYRFLGGRYRDFGESYAYKDNLDYYSKSKLSAQNSKLIEVKYHIVPKNQEAWEKSVRMRTSYRNDSIRVKNNSPSLGPPEENRQFLKLAENDESVTMNLWRLASQWLELTSGSDRPEKSLEILQDEAFGELYRAMNRLFSDQQLVLNNLGNPANGIFFQFDKGTSKRFSFQNLASGEKAALDLLLDLIVVKVQLTDTVFCIDEPEAHIHTKLQGVLLEELYNLVPENSQLWIATHSIGMVRKAQDLWRDDPNSVVFLDFGKDDFGQDRNFDDKTEITPAKPSPNLWGQTYDVALGDLAKLVAPQRIVLCESKAQDPAKSFDAACYNQIFGSRYPDTRFISIGNDKEVERADTHLIPVIQAIATGTEILRVRDRDDALPQEIEENAEKGIRILSHRNIEGYLLDDEVLTELCNREGKPDKTQDLLDAKQAALQKSIAEGKDHDDLKPTAQGIHVAAKNALKPSKMGNRSRNFMRDILAPLIQPGMKVYEVLHEDIFGE